MQATPSKAIKLTYLPAHLSRSPEQSLHPTCTLCCPPSLGTHTATATFDFRYFFQISSSMFVSDLSLDLVLAHLHGDEGAGCHGHGGLLLRPVHGEGYEEVPARVNPEPSQHHSCYRPLSVSRARSTRGSCLRWPGSWCVQKRRMSCTSPAARSGQMARRASNKERFAKISKSLKRLLRLLSPNRGCEIFENLFLKL